MRLALDVSKAGARDGLGTWTRGIVRGLCSALADDEPVADRILLYDLSGTLGEEALHAEFGDLGMGFESRLRPGRETRIDEGDVLLATSWKVPAACRLPLVFVVYDLTFLSHPACHTVDNRIHSLEGTLRAVVGGATFVAISEATARELHRHLDVPRDAVEVVYPGVEPGFRPEDADSVEQRLRNRFGLRPGYVLAVGSLEPRKNLERLIEAHGHLDDDIRRRHPLAVVGGGGWHNESLEKALTEAEGRGDVQRLGRVRGEDLATLYNGAAVFAYPSLAEGFGLPVLEAMACGTAVLTSNRSSMPEVAGDAGRLVDPEDTRNIHDTLRQLLTDDAERQRLEETGLRRSQSFSWAESARKLLGIAKAAVSESPPRVP